MSTQGVFHIHSGLLCQIDVYKWLKESKAATFWEGERACFFKGERVFLFIFSHLVLCVDRIIKICFFVTNLSQIFKCGQ